MVMDAHLPLDIAGLGGGQTLTDVLSREQRAASLR